MNHLGQGPPPAPSPEASCDANTLRKPLLSTPEPLLPNIQLRAQLPDELAEGSGQLSSSGDKAPQLSHSPGRSHSTPLKGLEGSKRRIAHICSLYAVFQTCPLITVLGCVSLGFWFDPAMCTRLEWIQSYPSAQNPMFVHVSKPGVCFPIHCEDTEAMAVLRNFYWSL